MVATTHDPPPTASRQISAATGFYQRLLEPEPDDDPPLPMSSRGISGSAQRDGAKACQLEAHLYEDEDEDDDDDDDEDEDEDEDDEDDSVGIFAIVLV